jgi:flagellar hook-length control protein FliK
MKIGSSELLTTAQPVANTNANGGVDPSSNFAALLQQSRAPVVAAAAKPPAPLPPVQARPATSAGDGSSTMTEAPDTDDGAPDSAATQPHPTPKPRARNSDAPAGNRASRDPRSTGSSRAESSESAARERAADAASSTSGDAKTSNDSATPPNWLAGLLPPATPPTPPVGRSDASTGDDAALEATDTADAGTGRGRGLSLASQRKADAHDTRARAELAPANAATQDAAPATSGLVAMLAEQRRTEPASRGEANNTRIESAHNASALSAASTATPANAGAATDASSTSAAHVRASVGSAEFPQELGVQLSVLARDGVQHAELHLNPAEMGPVSVQIVMDGTQARIDFGADVAATRQAIEAGLPELASALRDAGFTLAGGGVSQHAGGRRESSGDDDSRRASRSSRIGGVDAGDAADAAITRLVRTRVSAGGVDLYA